MSDQFANGTLRYRVDRIEKDLEQLEQDLKLAQRETNEKLDNLIRIFITGTITISVLLVGVAVTIVTQGHA